MGGDWQEYTKEPEGNQRISKAQNPFVSNGSFKLVKDSWVAKEMRKREATFSEYFELNVQAISWNVNSQLCSESLKPLFKQSAHIYVVGFQELNVNTDAYLLNDSTREDFWCGAILDAIGPNYCKVFSRQLVGMLVVLFADTTISQFITESGSDAVGTGLLGMIGNKGGVGIRFKVHDSYYCVINAHLAADVNMVDRRNSDFFDICRRMAFPLVQYKDKASFTLSHPWVANSNDSGVSSPETLTIFDVDHLIFMGDLNYRVNTTDSEARQLITQDLNKLLTMDQLNRERMHARAFKGFEEAPITFKPTFKFDVGTHLYDTSEKKRVPSWCDRILWYVNPIKKNDPDWCKCKVYDSCHSLVSSDHKPVFAYFGMKNRKLNLDLLAQAQKEIIRKLDRFENESIPNLSINGNHFEFGPIRYGTTYKKLLQVENTGQVIASYSFMSKPDEKSFIKCYPNEGGLLPGECIQIEIIIHVENPTELNYGKETIDDILILHIENGKDHFITIHGDWVPCSFGLDLQVLCGLDKPLADYSLVDLHDRFKTDVCLSPSQFATNHQISIPKQLFSLIDFIFKFGLDVDDLFIAPGNTSVKQFILQSLDTETEFVSILACDFDLENTMTIPPPDSNDRIIFVQSCAQLLIELLKTLPNPLIPRECAQKCVLQGYHSLNAAQLMLQELPTAHFNTFIYVTSFLKEFFLNYMASGITVAKVIDIMAPIIIPTSKEDQWDKKRRLFLQHFIE